MYGTVAEVMSLDTTKSVILPQPEGLLVIHGAPIPLVILTALSAPGHYACLPDPPKSSASILVLTVGMMRLFALEGVTELIPHLNTLFEAAYVAIEGTPWWSHDLSHFSKDDSMYSCGIYFGYGRKYYCINLVAKEYLQGRFPLFRINTT